MKTSLKDYGNNLIKWYGCNKVKIRRMIPLWPLACKTLVKSKQIFNDFQALFCATVATL